MNIYLTCPPLSILGAWALEHWQDARSIDIVNLDGMPTTFTGDGTPSRVHTYVLPKDYVWGMLMAAQTNHQALRGVSAEDVLVD